MAYIYLALFALSAAAYALVTSPEKSRVAAMFAVSTAVIAVANWIAYGCLALYTYHPGLVAAHRADEVLGELLGDIFFVPCVTVYLVRFVPGTPGVLTGTVVLALVEMLFIERGWFVDTGWNVGWSAATFPVYFYLMDRFWSKTSLMELAQGWQAKLLRVALLLYGVALLTLALRAGDLVWTNFHVMPTRNGNQALGRLIAYGLVTTSLGYWVTAVPWPARWIRAGITLAAFLAWDWFLALANMQFMVRPWSITLDAVSQTLVILLAALAEDGIISLAKSEDRWRPPVRSDRW